MKVIGVLHGMESSFPEALIEHINGRHRPAGVRAELLSLGAVGGGGEPEVDVVLDRISHEVPFYRSYLKWAALSGVKVVNNPFWWSADDKFIDNPIAASVGVAVPRTVILPHKEHPPNTTATSFRNLRYPLDWEAVIAHIGFPAFLKPHDGGGWRGVTKVHDERELLAAYDASGTDCMMLQEAIEFEEYYRCYGIGRRQARVMRYNPLAPHAARYSDVPPEPIPEPTRRRLERDTLALCTALGYDVNTVELAVRDGVPYAIDFMNPAPDADRASVGEANFAWVVEAIGDFLAETALAAGTPVPCDAEGLLAGTPAAASRERG